MFALLLVLLTFATGRLNVLPPRGTVYFLLLAAFWHVQARVMGLDYLGMSDMAAWAFVVLSLAAWACRGWVASLGQERVTAALAWVLLIGGCLQAAVAVMQYAGWTSHFTGYLALGAKKHIIGQLGQRNHLGHYLMWGLLSAAWLWSQRRLHALLGAAAVLFLSGTMGLVNSRTILLYVAAVGLLALFWRWRQGRGGNRLLLITLFALAMVVAVQFSLNTVLGWLGISQVETALQRIEGSSFAMSARDLEWRNAGACSECAAVGARLGQLSPSGLPCRQFSQRFQPQRHQRVVYPFAQHRFAAVGRNGAGRHAAGVRRRAVGDMAVFQTACFRRKHAAARADGRQPVPQHVGIPVVVHLFPNRLCRHDEHHAV